MRKTSIRSAGGLGVEIIHGRDGRPPKRRPRQSKNENDDADPDEQAPPPPGMGKFVDKII
jgi:hypothetical protein